MLGLEVRRRAGAEGRLPPPPPPPPPRAAWSRRDAAAALARNCGEVCGGRSGRYHQKAPAVRHRAPPTVYFKIATVSGLAPPAHPVVLLGQARAAPQQRVGASVVAGRHLCQGQYHSCTVPGTARMARHRPETAPPRNADPPGPPSWSTVTRGTAALAIPAEAPPCACRTAAELSPRPRRNCRNGFLHFRKIQEARDLTQRPRATSAGLVFCM